MNNKKLSYLYIAGLGHSGSTLLSFLLNSHPQMVSIGQADGPGPTRVHKKFYCSCGELFLQCPFYLKLEKQINDSGTPFSLTNWATRYRLSCYRWLNALLSRQLRNLYLELIRDKLVRLWPYYRKTIKLISRQKLHVAQAALAISDKQVFVDAAKSPNQIRFIQKIDQVDLYVIHLVRDVRGGVSSHMKASKIDVAQAARYWCRANKNTEQARRYVPPNRWFCLTYDELCRDPQSAVKQIADFVGIKRVEIPGNFLEVEHHILGNRMRSSRIGEVRQNISLNESFTKHDLHIIARIGGKLNRYFGHDWP